LGGGKVSERMGILTTLLPKFVRRIINYIKMVFLLANQFYYHNFQIRNRKKALLHIHSCKGINSVLKDNREVEETLQGIKRLKLKPHIDRPKNWDCYRAFSFILRHGSPESQILDVGSADYGAILRWLELYGFLNLQGCDISFEKNFHKGKINYSKQDLQNTSFESSSFGFITSISVIEHGVNVYNYLKEMCRLLKSGGYLLTSTDYWHKPIDTKGLYPYGKALGEMKIFTRNNIKELVRIAQEHGFELIEPIDFSYKEKVVYWERIDKKFTFIFFILKKV
jgi:SAM-dependent methyltransferase